MGNMSMAISEHAEKLERMDRNRMEQGMDLNERAQTAPDEMSEIPRELTMLKGAVTSLHSAANDLLGKVSTTVRDVPEDSAKISEIPTKFPVTTELSRALREIYDEVSTIENKLARAYHRSEL
jgi:uncharacterized protein YoxC